MKIKHDVNPTFNLASPKNIFLHMKKKCYIFPGLPSLFVTTSSGDLVCVSCKQLADLLTLADLVVQGHFVFYGP
jgi:hypothetical protein